jgi:hypothetical protein
MYKRSFPSLSRPPLLVICCMFLCLFIAFSCSCDVWMAGCLVSRGVDGISLQREQNRQFYPVHFDRETEPFTCQPESSTWRWLPARGKFEILPVTARHDFTALAPLLLWMK